MMSGFVSRSYAAFGKLAPGHRIAGYLIEEQVGSGGMAVVFRALDESLNRHAAVKVIMPSMTDDPVFRARFLQESQAAAAVDSPHILPVYRAGEADGLLYIATRFVAGGDLAQLVHSAGGRLPAKPAADLITQVAAALDAAHAAGLVHRDVKPQNVLVDTADGWPGHAYLTDFGVSKGMSSAPDLTASGQVLGTPDYCSPEQVRRDRVDGRADEYALGCMAFALLTGTAPYHRGSGMATMYAQLHDPIPQLTALVPDLPVAADEVIARALAKSPEHRYATCGEFAAALDGALAQTGPVPHPTRRGRVRPWAAAAAAAVVLVAAVSATVLVSRSSSGRSSAVTASSSRSATGDSATGDTVTARVLSGAGYGFHNVSGVAADGTHIWVASSNALTELDASNGSVLRTVSGASHGFNSTVAIADDGTHLWTANDIASVVAEWNASDGKLIRKLPTAGCLGGLDIAGPHVWAFTCSGWQGWSRSDGSPIRTLSGPGIGGSATMAVDGTDFWIGNNKSVTEVNASDYRLVRTMSGSRYGFNNITDISADGAHLWVASTFSNSVVELNASDGSVLRILSGDKYGLSSPDQIVPDHGHLWVANDDSVTELSAADGSVIRTLSGSYYGFDHPHIAVNGNDVWVASMGTNSVTELTIT